MLRRQYVSLLCHGYMGIYLGNSDRAMSQHFLNIPDIHIRLQKACGKGMAEHMGCDMQFNGGKFGVFIDHSSDGLVGQCAAVLVCEKAIAIPYLRQKILLVLHQDTHHVIITNLYFPLL